MRAKRPQTPKATELGNLQLIEKKVDIKKKRLELRNDRISLDKFEPRKIAVTEDEMLIQKIEGLRLLLSSSIIDDEKTVFGSEPIYKNILNAEEKQFVKEKLKELITKL